MSTGRARWLAGLFATAALLTGCADDRIDDRLLDEFHALCDKPETPSDPASSATDDVIVNDGPALAAALANSRPGQRIFLTAGTYAGPFKITSAGSRDNPIALCGEPGATITGTSRNNALHLDGAAWWTIQGVRVSDSKKGVMFDDTQNSSLVELEVTGIDQEAVHLRTNSSDNTVIGLRISDTGRTDPKFGEGVYVGSAVSNWCRYTNCSPDRSDRNRIISNTFGPDVRAENVDIKEGTADGQITANTFSGEGTTADSWVDLKGNAWTVTANSGAGTPEDGVAVRVEAEGWGNGNRITSNDMTINAQGYGVWVDSDAVDTVVGCDNEARGAQSGLSNIPCTE